MFCYLPISTSVFDTSLVYFCVLFQLVKGPMFALPTQRVGCLITLSCLVFKFEVKFSQKLLPLGCFASNFGWSKKWQIALLYVFTMNCDPKRYCFQTRRLDHNQSFLSFSETVYLLSASSNLSFLFQRQCIFFQHRWALDFHKRWGGFLEWGHRLGQSRKHLSLFQDIHLKSSHKF